ncbi:MAG: O-antigen ligase domain-containing protein [Rubrivivax sp.]|nr:MAG: O-antigen ligase domain-containing protein [Rubrivivax sp.]
MIRPVQAFPWLMGGLFGGLLLLGGPPLMMLAAVAVAFGVTIMAQPLRGFLLFCLIAPVIPWTTVTLGIRVTVSEALLAITWLGVFWQWLMGRLPPLNKRPTERAMLWFMAWSLVPLVAGQFVVAEGNGPVNWVRWLLNLSPLFLVPLLAPEPRQRQQMLLCLLLGYLAMITLSLGLFIQTRDARAMIPILSSLSYAHPEALQDIFGGDYTRMASPWVHPNSTGGALLLGVPLGAFYAVGHTGWRRALGVAVALGGTAGIVFSGSRGALLCLALLILWLARRRVPHAGRTLVIGSLLAAAMLVFYPPAQQRIASLFSSKDVSTGVRFEEYKHFPEAMARYPLGIGFKVDPPATGAGVFGISNLWLNQVYKLGLPGGLLFIAITVAWWREVRDLGDVSRLNARNAQRIGAVGGMLAALMTGFIDHYFSFTQVLLALFWLNAAIALQEARHPLDLPKP